MQESEIEVLKARIQQLEQLVTEIENDRNRLNNELINAQRESKDENNFSEHHKEQLLNLAQLINECFAKEQITSDITTEKQVKINL